MPIFGVLIHGNNFQVKFGNEISKHGFFTTVFVDSMDKKAAEIEAVSYLKSDENLSAIIKNGKSDPPKLIAEEINETSTIPDEIQPGLKRTGFAWYKE